MYLPLVGLHCFFHILRNHLGHTVHVSAVHLECLIFALQLLGL